MAKKKEEIVVSIGEIDVLEPCVIYVNGSEYKIEAGKQVLPEMVENVLRNAGKL